MPSRKGSSWDLDLFSVVKRSHKLVCLPIVSCVAIYLLKTLRSIPAQEDTQILDLALGRAQDVVPGILNLSGGRVMVFRRS